MNLMNIMLATSSLPHSLAIRFFKSNQIKQNKTEIRLPFKMSTTRSANKRIIILNQHEIFKEKDGLLRAIRLKHPKSDSLQPFLVISDQIYELVSYNQELGSVFIDDHVQSECATYFATKFNLVYFLISQCHARNSFVPLDQMLDSLLESDSDKDLLKNLEMPRDLDSLFDTKENQVQFNLEKCIRWLCKKVSSLEAFLTEKANASQSNKTKVKVDEEKCRVEAFELVAQYINKDLTGLLRKELKMSSPLEANDSNKMAKRVKTEEKAEPVVCE